MSNRKTIPKVNPKIPVGLSFSGMKGYKAFDILEEAKRDGYNKSEIVIELLNIYGKAKEVYGEDALLHLSLCSMGKK